MNAPFINRRSKFKNWILSLTPLFLLSLSSAKLPEPDTMYFGDVRHNTSDLFVPENTGEFVILAKLNGVTIAQTAMEAMSSFYKLKIPMDDSQEPRVPGTARAGERIKVYIRNTSTSTDYEVTDSIGLGIGVPTGTPADPRGILQSQDMAVTADLGGMGSGFASYGVWAAGYGIGSAPSSVDSDGDGRSNLHEFIAQTDPTSGADSFQIIETRRLNGVTAIRYGPIRLSRVYSIWCSPNLSEGSWSKVADIVPNTIADWRWYDHVSPATDHQFYKLTVDLQ